MQLKLIKPLLPAQNYEYSIISMTWSPNNEKLAVATTDRLILLYNESGDLKDKFQTKPADANDGKQSYLIQSICFSPDSVKLAVAQTDSIVYVYKIGESWGYKKVICNKFLQQCPITCMIWLSAGPLICGLIIGQVMELSTKTNKSQKLYSTDSIVISLCSNSSGTGLLSGHVDGNIFRFFAIKEASNKGHENDRKFICHPSVPSILVWTEKWIMVAGLDRKICFYDIDGLIVKQLDYSNENFDYDFSSAVYNKMAQTILVGSSNRAQIFTWDDKGHSWQELDYVDLHNFYTITALAWKKDGTKIACGSLCGSLILFESVTRRIIWKNCYEISFIGRNCVIIKSLKSSKTTTISTKFEIDNLNFKILDDNRYFVGKSDDSLIISDLKTNRTSQIFWNTGSSKINEQFNFRHEHVCLVRSSAQLFVIAIGRDVIDYTLTTKYTKEDLISLQYGENGKYLAYLEEAATVKILNMDNDTDTRLINHDSVIDWLQLSNTIKMVIYRDVQQNVYLYDVIVLNKIEIMNCVRYVKWLPNDIFVCQNEAILAVWLDINTPEYLQMDNINDMVIDVVKNGTGGGVQVVIDHNNGGQSNLEFDNQIVEFRLAIKENDIKKLAKLVQTYPDKLSNMDLSLLKLANIALSNKSYFLSENYYTALREYTSCPYLKKVKEFLKTGLTIDDGIKNAILNNDFIKAEEIYFQKNDIPGAISMYRKLHYWDDALRISKKHDPDMCKNIRNDQIEYLKSANQFEQVAKIFEQDHDYERAFDCYLQGKKPDEALSMLCNRLTDQEFHQRAINQFAKYGFLKHSGDLCLKCERIEDALNYYQQGKVWPKVISLSKDMYPDKVLDYYQYWAVDLMASEQWDESIDCFMKAGCPNKALECAINGKLWKKAADITKFVKHPEHVETYYVQLADHFISEKDYVTAEYLLLSIKQDEKAIDMLNETYQWERSYKLAKHCLNEDDVDELFRNQAKLMQNRTKFNEAERILLMLNDADSAIEMYKNIEHFDDMIRLVEKFHPDLLIKTHYYVAMHLESRGSFSDAEAHYLAANEWKKTVNMYRNAAMWDDAYRIAKQYGGKRAANQVIFLRAKDLPTLSAKKYLEKNKLRAECIDYACDIEDFQWAFELSNNSENQIQDIHSKYAKKLQNDGKYSEAEHEYILADRAKQAVTMYLETKDWANAIRVADTFDKKLVDDILKTQALHYFDEKKFPEFQSIYVRLKAIDELISHYRNHNMWAEALKISKEYKPNSYHELLKEFNNQKVDESDIDALINQANQWINVEQYQEAVSCLMKIAPDTTEESIMRKILLKIVEIITKFFTKNATVDVIKVIGPQLVKFKENTIAAQLYISIEMFKEAIDVLIGCNDWKRAKKVVQKYDSSLDTYLNSKYKEALQQTSDVDKLIDIDIDIDFNETLNLLLTNGEWVKCLEKSKSKSKSQNDELFQQYFEKFAEYFRQNGDVGNALEMFTKYGIPSCTNGPKYLVELANNIFADCENVQLFVQLRDLLHSLVITDKLSNSKLNDQLSTYFLISYFYSVKDACYESESQLSQINLKISISLLRFCNIIPADKVFYDAAMNLRQMRRDNEAFVFFSYYLNICDAIENRRTTINLTIPELPHLPQSVQLPKQLYWKDQLDKHDKVREWILELISMDHKLSKKLPLSQESFYESYLKPEDDFCIITGYPIRNQFVTFNKSKLKANRESWAKITMTAKKFPLSHKLNSLLNFIEKWCGTSNFSYL